MNRGRIRSVVITPLAFADPPLLNADGVHEPHVLRALIEVEVEDGRGGTVVGLGESTGHAWQLDWLELVGPLVEGSSVFDTAHLNRVVRRALSGEDVDASPESEWRRWSDRSAAESRGPAPLPAPDFDRRRVYAALEVAFLDAAGKLLSLPVSALLGGARRASVDYAGYLFYKFAEHPGQSPDSWGAALDPEGIVRQAETMVERYGFRSLKLKGGVFSPEEEIAALEALKARFPTTPLRIDPNTAWSLKTTLEGLPRLGGLIEYLEDPVRGLAEMAEVASASDIPLATNMCVTSLSHVAEAVRLRSVSIVLADHHYWEGLRGTAALDAVCTAAGFGLSMHSNSHLGVSLSAMTHAAASTNLHHAADTHYPWNADDDIVLPGSITIADGSVTVPTAPGLGVEIDRSVVARLHDQYVALGREHRMDQRYAVRLGASSVVGPLPRW